MKNVLLEKYYQNVYVEIITNLRDEFFMSVFNNHNHIGSFYFLKNDERENYAKQRLLYEFGKESEEIKKFLKNIFDIFLHDPLKLVE